MYLLSLGSKTEIKYKAVSNAVMRIGVNFEIARQDVGSGVNEQPIGLEETADGARHRAKAAAMLLPGSWGVGIENGLICKDGIWYDLAVVTVIAPDGTELAVRSDEVEFPSELVAEAVRRGVETTTVGAIIAERHGSAADDPHAFLTDGKRSRVQILSDAVEEALRAAWGIPRTHRIGIGKVIRDLPIREVKPGVRVALFNILGDWELTEAAGGKLADGLPVGQIDALVMPEGKAIALLHVVGRECRRPTFVARKEKKPYMAEPVEVVEYGSITTKGRQSLFLGADDAAKLKGKRVVIVDDVVSTGGTLKAMEQLMAKIGARVIHVAAVLTEGDPRPGVIALGHLPLF